MKDRTDVAICEQCGQSILISEAGCIEYNSLYWCKTCCGQSHMSPDCDKNYDYDEPELVNVDGEEPMCLVCGKPGPDRICPDCEPKCRGCGTTYDLSDGWCLACARRSEGPTHISGPIADVLASITVEKPKDNMIDCSECNTTGVIHRYVRVTCLCENCEGQGHFPEPPITIDRQPEDPGKYHGVMKRSWMDHDTCLACNMNRVDTNSYPAYCDECLDYYRELDLWSMRMDMPEGIE